MDGEKGGCGIAGLALVLFAVLVLIVLGMNLYGQAQDAQTQRIYAEQALVVSQSQARLDAAQATAVTSAAMFPYLVMGLVGLGSLGLIVGIVALGLSVIRLRQVAPLAPQPVIVLLPADVGRRELAQLTGPFLEHSAAQIIDRGGAREWQEN